MDRNASVAHDGGKVPSLKCRACAKLHRVKELPRDSAGRPALFFRFTCLGCGHTEVTHQHEIISHVVAEQRASESPSSGGDIGAEESKEKSASENAKPLQNSGTANTRNGEPEIYHRFTATTVRF